VTKTSIRIKLSSQEKEELERVVRQQTAPYRLVVRARMILLLARGEKTGQWESMHHPFTAPRDEDVPLLDKSPEKAQGRHYDLICNGYELGGGSIRIRTAEVQRKLFQLLGYSDEEIDDRFGHMLEAFEHGAPPHGGIALGLDRIVMLLAGEETIREVIAFPKNQNAADLTLNAPSPVSQEQLAELHLRLREE